MFMGEYHHNIDDKARLVMPSKFRYELGNNFIITRGLDGCLFIYTMDEWNNLVLNLKKIPFTKKDARAFLRFFLSGAQECTFDKQGRIILPQTLISYAEIKKECIIIGVNERLEVWSKEKYESYFNQNEESITDIVESLFDKEI